jgi:predicted transcriptional regulator
VEIALTNADTYLQSWRRILRTVTSAQSEELKQARDELEECLRSIEEDIQDLTEAIHILYVWKSDRYVRYCFIP